MKRNCSHYDPIDEISGMTEKVPVTGLQFYPTINKEEDHQTIKSREKHTDAVKK